MLIKYNYEYNITIDLNTHAKNQSGEVDIWKKIAGEFVPKPRAWSIIPIRSLILNLFLHFVLRGLSSPQRMRT